MIETRSYTILYNFLLPFVIIVAFSLRLNFASFVYFVFSLFLPLTVSPPTSKYPGHPYRFISCVTSWAALSLSAQCLFNFFPWETVLGEPLLPFERHMNRALRRHNASHGHNQLNRAVDCHPFARWLRQMGLDTIREHWSATRTANLFAPDLLVFVTGGILLLRLRILQHRKHQTAIRNTAAGKSPAPPKDRKDSLFTSYFQKYEWRKHIGRLNNAFLPIGCCIVGSFHPSILSLPYFATFLVLATLWAFRVNLSPIQWTKCRRILLLYCAAHLCLLYIYQLPNVYRNFPEHELEARLLGLIHFAKFPCDNILYPMPIPSWIWPEYLSPFVIFVFYYIVATQVAILRENEEVEQLDSLFGANKSALAALVQTTQHGTNVALGYKKKAMESPCVYPEKVSPTIASKKMSTVSTVSSRSKKFSANLAERLNAMKMERDRMKNFAKWENLKPILEAARSQSYVIALIVLMAWSLCYHSWSTFVMLILSFIIWMHPNSHTFYNRLSMFIVIYAEGLLILQFIFALPLTQNELPDEHPPILRQLGFEKPRNNAPVIDMLLKSLFNLAFWFALRNKLAPPVKPPPIGTLASLQSPTIIVERDSQSESSSSSYNETEKPAKPSLLQRLKTHVTNFWVVLVLGLLLMISMTNPVVFYRIVYMVFFLVFICTFAVSFPLFRKMLYRFWVTMIGYCIFVVTLIYTYQFHGIPELYHDYLGMSPEVAKSLGLERISASRLLFRLLTPITFLIVSLIQLNFFHEKMMEVTQKWEEDVYGLKLRFLMAKLKLFQRQLNYLESGLDDLSKSPRTPEGAAIKGLAPRQRMKKVIGEIEKKCKQVLSYRQSAWNILWRFAEIHINRVVAGVIVYIAVKEVSSLNVPLVICVAIMLPLEEKAPKICDFVAIMSGVIVILKMVFQMEFIPEDQMRTNCLNEDLVNGTASYDPGAWFGMRKVPSIFYHCKWHLFIILSLVFRELIKIRQFLHRKKNRSEEPPRGIMFFGIDRRHADNDLVYCALYFSNYFFYKFGVEVTFIASVIAISIRNDIIAVFYACWLMFLLTRTRHGQRDIWPYYTAFTSVCFALQYLLCVGLPGFLCIGYFWDSWDDALIEWLCLPSHKVPPTAEKLFSDFAFFLAVSAQFYSFRLETKHGASYPGGSNELIPIWPPSNRALSWPKRCIASWFDANLYRVKPPKGPCPRPLVTDFISDSKTFLDKLKYVFFMYFYWLTLSMIFIAGTTHVTLFAAGYVFGCFLFLWLGTSLFFKPIIVALRMWDLLLFYNVAVILLKTILQLVGCVYMSRMYKNFCWLLQLLGVACNKAGYSTKELIDPEILAECDIPHTEAGIFYDNLCFVFLLIQRRIFGSEYFKHVMAELKAQRFFASRGAELIEKINKQEVQEALLRESDMMKMVDNMVAKISRKHEKIKQKGIEDPLSNLSTPDMNEPLPHNLPHETSHYERPPSTVLHAPIVVEVPQPLSIGTPSTLSPMSPQLSPGYPYDPKISNASLDAPRPVYRQNSASEYRSMHGNQDLYQRRKSANDRFDNSDDDGWSIGSSERQRTLNRRKTTDAGGVKGLGPLQLLNFAIKKGAIRDAVNESNAIEAKHEQMEKEMEKTTGSVDYHQIRKRILKNKARQKAKPDFDEETFETDALTNVRKSQDYDNDENSSHFLIGPKGASVTLDTSMRNQMPTSVSFGDASDLLEHDNEDDEELSGDSIDELRDKLGPMTKSQKIRRAYLHVKAYVMEYTKLLAMFVGMFLSGTIESLIAYLMHLSRDYRYIAYILREERQIHKELFNHSLDVDEPISKVTRHQQRALIREKLHEKYDKSGFLNDENLRKLHQYVEDIEVEEDSRACELPTVEILDETSVIKSSDSVSEASSRVFSSKSSNSSNHTCVSGDVAVIQPAIIVHRESGEEGSPSVVYVPEAVVPVESLHPEMCEKLYADTDEPNQETDPFAEFPSVQSKSNDGLFVRFVIALYFAVLSHSELICYVMVIANHINSASLLSMPLPFMVFLWGTLTVPLPRKNFWITLIGYTEAMVILKYFFQFGFFPWNHAAPSLDPFWAPRIIGIERRPKYAMWDLLLLMALFLHRNILLSTGLWRNDTDCSDDVSEASEPSITDNAAEDSKCSAAPSLLLPMGPNTGAGKFARRFTAISFTSVTQKFQSEKIKAKSFDCLPIITDESPIRPVTLALSDTIFENNTKSADVTLLLSPIFKVGRKVTKVQGFFGVVLNPVNRVPIDVYAPMFLCDIICFLIVIFGFSSFGTDQGAGSVAAYFEENKVPGTLVAMLIIQFVLIVADRALFLRKFLFGKLCFQLFLVLFVHIWIFFLLPAATDRLFVNNYTCKLWYFVKSIYFLISAKQIRCGYPKFSVGNVLTRNYNYFNYALKNAYMKVPFLYEMGLLTDWIWKDTSLNLGDWITLHDIYSNIARLKCVRNWEEDFPSPKGVKQRPFIKYGYGGLLLFLIILIIWFPLVLFSMANTVGIRSIPVECTVRLTIAGYQPLFDSTAQLGDIQHLSDEEYDQLWYTYRMSKTALSYIADYTNEDVVKATINGNSASQWQISPPAREYMIEKLNSTLPMSMQFEWNFKRAPNEELQYGIVEDNRIVALPAGDKIRQQLIDMINGESTEPILIPDLFPSMVKVPGEGKSDHVNALLAEHLKGSPDPIESTFVDVQLELISTNGVEYWRLKMIDQMYDPIRKTEPIIRDKLVFYGFVDKVFPKSFSIITGGGILGLYISIVFLLGQYIRGFVIDSMQAIMFEELPNVDRILDLCHKIFFVRDVSRFDLEEALYANLVFLFRSPATLIKWTKERLI